MGVENGAVKVGTGSRDYGSWHFGILDCVADCESRDWVAKLGVGTVEVSMGSRDNCRCQSTRKCRE